MLRSWWGTPGLVCVLVKCRYLPIYCGMQQGCSEFRGHNAKTPRIKYGGFRSGAGAMAAKRRWEALGGMPQSACPRGPRDDPPVVLLSLHHSHPAARSRARRGRGGTRAATLDFSSPCRGYGGLIRSCGSRPSQLSRRPGGGLHLRIRLGLHPRRRHPPYLHRF